MAKPNEHIFFNNLPDFEKEAEEERRRRKMPKTPSFSLDDMEDARKASYDKGHTDGLQTAKDSIEQQTEILIQSLTSRIHELEQSEVDRHDLAIQNAIAISQKALQNLLPVLIDKNGQGLILESLKTFFTDHTPQSTMTLFVHKDMVKAVDKHVKNLSSTLIIEADDSLSQAQARLEWIDGTYQFKPDIMVENILKIVDQYLMKSDDSLDDLAQNTHNNEETDKKQDS